MHVALSKFMTKNNSTTRRVSAAILALGIFPIASVFANPTASGNLSATSNASAGIRVMTAKPQAAVGQKVSVEQPANIAAYYQVELFPKVAGTIKSVEKALGDKIVTGEALVQLDTGDASGNLTTISAPFDGVVSARSADPGLFVASAAIVPGVNSLMTVDRTDIVTISMPVPEAYVRFLTKDAEVELRTDAMPGRIFRCRLSRIAPSMNAGDRTLTVEVDLFNGTSDEYTKFVEQAEVNGRRDLKGRALPFFPEGMSPGQPVGLLPGMYGMMKLTMQQPAGIPLVPSSAIVREGGMTYLFKNDNGIARRIPIVIQSDNGTAAGVLWALNGVNQELSPEDEIVISNQGELQDGLAIQGTLSK